MISKNISLALCVSLSMLAFPCEAKAVVVSKITDSKATQAYIKQVEELVELYEQGKKMQRQIEQLQQSLEHFDFKNIDQTFNFLNDTMRGIESIEKNAAGMSVTIGELEDNWTEMHTDYDAKDMTPERREELNKKRKERLDRNAKVTAEILTAAQDMKRERKQMELLSNDLSLLNSGKASPIKAAQVMSQILVHQMDQNKRTQKLIAEKMRSELIKEEMRKDEEKQKLAEAEKVANAERKVIKAAGTKHEGTKYPSSAMSYDEIMAADN